MVTNGIPSEERDALIKKYHRYMDRYMRQALYGVDRCRWPILIMEQSGGTYTNVLPEVGKTNYIHLDVGDHICIDDEADFVNTCEVLIGHEVQHIRSTTNKGWTYGLNGGKLAICQEHQKSAGGKAHVLRTPQDCDRYINNLCKSGYKISINSIENFVHFIMNSVEDGRIERIRCNQRPGFRKKLATFRGKLWLESEMKEVTAKDLKDPGVYVTTVLNQVLSLSTMSIYQKGFTKSCLVSSGPMEEVQTLMPYIAGGVASDSCRKGMQQAIEICRILALKILEASKMTPLEELLQMLSEAFSSAATYSADSSNEEMDGNAGQSLFGNSCLVIELEDEEFDRLEKEKKKNGPSGEGARIIFKRKHPKEEEKEEKNEDGSSGQEDSSNEENADSSAPSSNDSSSSKEDGISGASSGEGCGKSSKAEDTGKSTGISKEKSAEEAEKETDGFITEAIRNTIRESEGTLMEDAETAERIAAADQASKPEQFVIRTKEDESVDVSSVNEAYAEAEQITFHETTRKYNPDVRMPMDLLGKAETLKRRLMQILKNQEEPEVRERKSGILDTASVYKLALGNLDCFIKNGISSEFNGCVEILMDRSGSMGGGPGSKFQLCCEALSMIEHAFEDIVPMKIAAFDARGSQEVHHEIIKDWHEKLPYGGAYNFMIAHGCANGGNKDGYSIRIATKELEAQSYQKKILIVLSDGLPSDYYGGYRAGMEDVLSAVRTARKEDIEVISIYFGEGDSEEQDNFRTMYDNKNCIVTEPDQVCDRLYDVMKACVTTW